MKAIDLDPKLANAWNNLGAVYYHLGNYSKAVEYYRKAIDLAPKDAVQWSNLGTAYNRLGNYDKGIECLYKAADCRGMVATLSAQNRAYGSGNDYSMLKMESFDSYGSLIDSASSAMDQGTSTWHLIQVSAKVPQNAVTARISLYSFYRSGSEADSYFDNVSLTTDLERVELY
ncbi:MAG: tetratricopeptide repeat protein [Selenomonas sp.]|nr:tetratricopeptide repeat protein [Selenomonas sp.]